jgi:hypothetical protein
MPALSLSEIGLRLWTKPFSPVEYAFIKFKVPVNHIYFKHKTTGAEKPLCPSKIKVEFL